MRKCIVGPKTEKITENCSSNRKGMSQVPRGALKQRPTKPTASAWVTWSGSAAGHSLGAVAVCPFLGPDHIILRA